MQKDWHKEIYYETSNFRSQVFKETGRTWVIDSVGLGGYVWWVKSKLYPPLLPLHLSYVSILRMEKQNEDQKERDKSRNIVRSRERRSVPQAGHGEWQTLARYIKITSLRTCWEPVTH